MYSSPGYIYLLTAFAISPGSCSCSTKDQKTNSRLSSFPLGFPRRFISPKLDFLLKSFLPVTSQGWADGFTSHRSFHPSCWHFASKPGRGDNLHGASKAFQMISSGLTVNSSWGLILNPHHLIWTWSRAAGEAAPWQSGQSWTIKGLLRLGVVAFR